MIFGGEGGGHHDQSGAINRMAIEPAAPPVAAIRVPLGPARIADVVDRQRDRHSPPRSAQHRPVHGRRRSRPGPASRGARRRGARDWSAVTAIPRKACSWRAAGVLEAPRWRRNGGRDRAWRGPRRARIRTVGRHRLATRMRIHRPPSSRQDDKLTGGANVSSGRRTSCS